jgi:hypothetical protein
MGGIRRLMAGTVLLRVGSRNGCQQRMLLNRTYRARGAPPRSSSLLPPPSIGCMTDSNLSGTSSASCAVALLLLLAVARVAAMPLWASIPTDLFVVFLYILHLP